MGLSEIFVRVTRLVSAVILARYLSPEQFGIVAIAMTTQELLVVFNRNGIGAKIIQTPINKLAGVTHTIYRLNWQINLTLFLLQCLVAEPVARFYDDPELAYLIYALAVPYLIYPFSLVQVYLIQRENRLKVTALATGVQVSIDNIFSAILAFSGFGVWAIILPKLVVAPLWVIFHRALHPWRPSRTVKRQHRGEIFRYSRNILGSEVVKAVRQNIDRLLIGHFLGMEILGLYYFAVNNGLGIGLSLVNSFNTAFFPHLCAIRNHPNRFRRDYLKGLTLITLASILVLGAQSLAAPWYVPIIFGEQWLPAVPVLIIIALSGIPRPLAEAAAQMLRAIDQPQVEFQWNLLLTLTVSYGIFIALNDGVLAVATYIMFAHLLIIPIYVICSYLFNLKRELQGNLKIGVSL
jgi:PST family polysaccharide transporter